MCLSRTLNDAATLVGIHRSDRGKSLINAVPIKSW